MEENNPNATTEKFTIDPEYFIQLAIQNEIPWKALALMLTDLTTTLDRSKKIIRVLVQELEKWVLNFKNDSPVINKKDNENTIEKGDEECLENDSNHFGSDSRVPNEKVAKDQIQEDKENIIEKGDEEYLENCDDDSDAGSFVDNEEPN